VEGRQILHSKTTTHYIPIMKLLAAVFIASTADAFQVGSSVGRVPSSSSLNAVAETLEKTFSSRPAGKSRLI